MIFEWFEYLVTPASDEAKKWGHLKQSIALRARAARQKENWKSHLKNCHQFVDESLRQMQTPAKSVMILGSGHLFDISENIFDPAKNPQIEKIVLVDVVHPLEVRKRAQSDPRIVLMERDLSGGMPSSFSVDDLTTHFHSLPLLELPTVDFVISANIMSQLPLPAVQAAEKWLASVDAHSSGSAATDFETLRRTIETQMSAFHWQQLEFFSAQGAEVVFWTDFEKHFFDSSGDKIHRESSLGEFKFSQLKGSWIWDIAPIPEISKKFGLQMIVGFGKL